ncbi:unnamed protein product [Hyaloperonospora brassicae]|uniref:RxLR effector candidate protein n=1 Tax=Hyaloperonospora brassicae TaxID=162125 RepID=A0AAV0U6L7_HYABA|nr:unnamed protein product [Hyaloperonospora brassicae]
MYVPHHLLPIACAILCLGKSAASTKASGLQDNALPLSVTTVPFQDNATSVSVVDREGQGSEERFYPLLIIAYHLAEAIEEGSLWAKEILNVHPRRMFSKYDLHPTADAFSNGVGGRRWLDYAVKYRSKNKKKGEELTDLKLFEMLKNYLVSESNLLEVANRLRVQDESSPVKRLSVVFYRALLKDCSPETSKLMRDEWAESIVTPDDVFLALGIKVEDLVDHPAVVYQWLRYIARHRAHLKFLLNAGYQNISNEVYTTEQIKAKLEGASEDQIRKFVDEALKQEDKDLDDMLKEVWGIERPGTVTETAVAT